jgi:hypothetical protein
VAGVIARAAICPATPLLARPLSGREPVLADLRSACATAVGWLLSPRPSTVVLVGSGAASAELDPSARLDLSRYAPGFSASGLSASGLSASSLSALEPAAGLGGMLLDEAGWDGERVVWSVAGAPADCVALGRRLAESHDDAVLLAMGDGSAARLLAPDSDRQAADDFDATVESALRSGDLGVLESLDAGLADELTATGRPAWQVLAGALGTPYGAGALGTPYGAGRGAPRGGAVLDTSVLYADAPLGVRYFVATLAAA